MKKTLLALTFAFCLVVCGCENKVEDNYIPSPVGSLAHGADISWLTEQEANGVLFYNNAGDIQDCMALCRDHGMDAVRLRVWVNHSTGWCNKEDVLVKARRAAALRLRIMIDFHYSDFFVDPGKQQIPTAWKEYDFEELKDAVATHTKDVLSTLQGADITPEWVQVGNETRNGMLWPIGQLWDINGDIPDGWSRYAALTTAGYDAVKEIFPQAVVIVHIDNAWNNNNWFFRKLRANGGKFDMIGLSHYPMSYTDKSWKQVNELALANMKLLFEEFTCKIMIAEVGIKASHGAASECITDFVNTIATHQACAGVFYWEPQVYKNWKPAEYNALGWSAYDMGAFTPEGKVSDVLDILWKH